jgi:hypothetical protein
MVKSFEVDGKEPFGVRINYTKLNESFPEFLPDYNFSTIRDTDDLYQFVEFKDQYHSWYTEDNYKHLGDKLFCLHPSTSKDFEPGKPWIDYPILYDSIEYSDFQNNLVTTSRFYREEQVINIKNNAVICDYWNDHWYRSEINFTFLGTDLLMERHYDLNGRNWISIYEINESHINETGLNTIQKLEAYVNAGFQFYEDVELDLIADLEDHEIAQFLIQLNPLLIEHFSDKLRDDSGLVELATALSDDAFVFASERLREDHNFIERLISGLPNLNVVKFYESLTPNVKNNMAVAICALAKDPETFNYLAPELKNQEELKRLFKAKAKVYNPPCNLRWTNIQNFSLPFQENVLNSIHEQAYDAGLHGAADFIDDRLYKAGVLYYFSQNGLTEKDIDNLPTFYTNIHSVSFDHGGLLALEHCYSQAFQVFTFLGTPLFDELMHDVDFHLDGSITVRPCDVQIGWHSRYQLELPELILLDRAGFDNDLFHLPQIGLRDQLVCIDEGRIVENVFNPLSTQNSLEYINKPEKAVEVVWSWPEAFSQLSWETKNNLNVQRALLDGLTARHQSLSPWLRVYSMIQLDNLYNRSELIEFIQNGKLDLDVFPDDKEFEVLLAFAESGAEVNAKTALFFDKCSEHQWHELVHLNGHLLERVPEHLKSNEMYKLAAKSYVDILSQAPKVLKMDIDFALSIVREHPNAIRFFEGIKTEHKDLIAAWNAYQEWLVPDDDLPF